MNRSWTLCIAMLMFAWPAWGQRVETQKLEPGKIIHVQTALNHLTVLEMSEPVITVAVGSPSFRVEWRENRVFIEPIEPDVDTNLFVWTSSGRFNYELEPAGTVPGMVFAIDQPAVDPRKSEASQGQTGDPPEPSPADVLMATRPVRLLGTSSRNDHLAVYITGVLEREGEVLIRYTIRNETNRAYVPGSPQVMALHAPRYRESLYTLRDCQLSPGERVKSDGITLVPVVKWEAASPRVEPGSEGTGIVTIQLPSLPGKPTVLSVNFLAGPHGPVSATLVL